MFSVSERKKYQLIYQTIGYFKNHQISVSVLKVLYLLGFNGHVCITEHKLTTNYIITGVVGDFRSLLISTQVISVLHCVLHVKVVSLLQLVKNEYLRKKEETMMRRLCSRWLVESLPPTCIWHLWNLLAKLVLCQSAELVQSSDQENSRSAVSTVTENFQGVAVTHPHVLWKHTLH